jgi:diaminopimelate decarboxylase
MAFPNAFGLTVRYAMKASPNAAILKVLRKAGLNIDASSGYEVRRVGPGSGCPPHHLHAFSLLVD